LDTEYSIGTLTVEHLESLATAAAYSFSISQRRMMDGRMTDGKEDGVGRGGGETDGCSRKTIV
jgi:hypothetical protein